MYLSESDVDVTFLQLVRMVVMLCVPSLITPCRPGGGPAGDGRNAPWNDPPIQRAWYNGWKKLRGLKWQAVDFPNGMNGHVYSPISIRQNDLITAN